ncbi:MAG TPA: FGGY-family carbohydrate kinase [Draconibacterium sp.]|nr:FGGY-family carbohydrate kinase [Draconibacterium sp.]
MNKNIVIAHDVGTSSVKSALIDSSGNILNECSCTYPFYNPKPGWVEQEPEDYWNAIVANTRNMVESVNKNNISGIVFTTQAMGIIPVDASGKILYRNITWVDGRAEEQAQRIMTTFGGRKIFKSFLGIEITGKDVIPKLIWLKKNESEIYKSTHKILDVNGYLRFKATGKTTAEWSGACSYGFNLKKKDWEHLLFRAAGFDRTKLPKLIRSTDIAGTLTAKAALELALPAGIPVFGGCDDTQSAAIGSGSIGEGEVHAYIGTSAWLGVTTAKSLKFKNGAVCVQSADPQKNLVIGITESAGNNLEWLINQFYQKELKTTQREDIYGILDKEAEKVPAGSDHLIITPWFLGERCPVSSTTTRSTIFNLSLEHTRGHFVKAMSEGIGYNLRWIAENYQKDFGFAIPGFRLIGGGSKNQHWMQTIADITGRTVTTTNHPTMAGAIGAAMCAFVGLGVFDSFSAVNKMVQPAAVFNPDVKNKSIYDELYSNYKDIYHSLKGTYKKANSKRF